MRPILILSLLIMTIASSSARELLVYIGTYTKTSKGIYVGRFDTATGKLGELTLAAEASNPSFVALSPDRRFLYAVSEGAGMTFNDKPSGSVLAYSINADTGALTLINSAASAGRGPCHVSVSPDGKSVLVANYSSGTAALLPVRADGGVNTPASFDQHEGKSIHPSPSPPISAPTRSTSTASTAALSPRPTRPPFPSNPAAAPATSRCLPTDATPT